MITFLIIMTIICIAAAILDHASGMDRKPTSKKYNNNDWSLKTILKNPPRDIAHSPSKRYRRR